jgi:Protein of unknown function (DUF732)
MTIEDRNVPTGSAPHKQPRPARQSRSSPVGIIVVAAAVAVAALAGLSYVADYFLRDRTASSPAAPTVTLTASSKAPALADGADGKFLSALASYGISDNGTEASRQRFMEFGHHVCFALLPPRPQSLDSAVDNILAEENQDVAKGDPWAPRFTHDDAEHLAQAAIGAYCPNAQK